MRTKLSLIFLTFLAGCVTMSGSYSVTAYDAQGKLLNEKMQLVAEGSGIYTTRNAICQAYPQAIVRIKEVKTGAELKSESPYQCP